MKLETQEVLPRMAGSEIQVQSLFRSTCLQNVINHIKIVSVRSNHWKLECNHQTSRIQIEYIQKTTLGKSSTGEEDEEEEGPWERGSETSSYQMSSYFVLRTRFFGISPLSALFLGNMLSARKYRFALCFRVLTDQYVKRNAFANVVKFNKKKKCFERAKVNSR